ncbi:DNA helicase Rep [Parathalassolituus penaei]|uniref:ATP-dependent DNA helicase Rep n=1 Tax=Parathalassolituus penaei TaxID=2997323 RepID=A0A9X3EDQ1_9GAMM|nr:DNA helicase Rep [Parathalassolituus penaei]MCY0965703.1 DNA helicase Rep [Parathalassolituus penaei]
MVDLSQLNPRQKEAAKYVEGPLLVLAGAGSGKTSVITRKIAYLIDACGIKPHHIAAVTFTNKAAREMKERVMSLVGKGGAKGLTVSTFHNLGLNIIRQELETSGYRAGFSILDQDDCKGIIRDVMQRDHGGDDGDMVEMVQNTISNLKNDLITPEQAINQAQSPQEMLIARTYSVYQRMLKAYNAVDFDDLIMVPTLLFMNHSEVLMRWQRKIRYLLVDEYQDTNTSQYELVKLLVGHRSGLTVVGDDDQSIYAWRGARPENLVLLKQDFPSLKVVKLEQNYRSTGLILNAANKVIDNNPHEFEKKLWSDMGYGDPIRILKCKSDEIEAERIASEIVERRLRYGCGYRDFAVLYRGNHQSRAIEMKLQTFQVPYKLNGGQSFFGRNEIKDLMGYLRLLINPSDDAAFLRVINTPRREIGPTTIEKLSEYASMRDTSMLAATTEMGLEQLLSPKSLDRLRRFGHWLENITRNAYTGDPIAAIKELISDIDYEGHLTQTSSSPGQAERRMKNVWFLVDSIQKMITKAEELGDECTIEDAVGKLLLRDMLEQQEQEDELDQVQLMTLHASKGLEFPHVYIMGMEEELMPHRNSIEADTVEEERRLMYVGITRAKRTLTLTYAAKRRQYGESTDTTHSRFLDELPPDDVEWEGKTEISPEAQRQRGQETLSSLKNLLGDF